KTRQTLLSTAKRRLEEAKSKSEQDRWEAVAMFEASERGENQRVEQFKLVLDEEDQTRTDLRAQSDLLLQKYRHIIKRGAPIPGAKPQFTGDPIEQLRAAIQQSQEALNELGRLHSPAMISGANLFWLFAVPLLLIAGPAIYLLGVSNGLIASAIGAAL